MIPFRTFALPKIHASIARGFLNESKLNGVIDELDDLFGGGIDLNAKEEPSAISHLSQPKKEVTQSDFIGDYEKHHELGDHLRVHYTFNPEHVNTIQRYTGTHYHDNDGEDRKSFRYVNARILRMNGHEPIPSDEHRMNLMDAALHSNKAPRELTVYSGLGRDHGGVVASNDKVHHPAYLSSSIRPDMAMGFAHGHLHGIDTIAHILKIHIPQGHPGAYVDHISRNPGEHEFILPRDTTLRIDHSKREYLNMPFRSGGSRHYLIHHAYPTK